MRKEGAGRTPRCLRKKQCACKQGRLWHASTGFPSLQPSGGSGTFGWVVGAQCPQYLLHNPSEMAILLLLLEVPIMCIPPKSSDFRRTFSVTPFQSPINKETPQLNFNKKTLL